MAKATRRKANPDMEDGATAWRARFIDLYDYQCDIHEAHKMIEFQLEAQNPADALGSVRALVARHEKEIADLCRA
jgi:hypothetical protein